ncbi:hypothetical protein N305_02999, partial [Manacus vitellinus]
RAAGTMWRTIIFSSRTAQSVLEILTLVLGSWPACSMCTSDEDETDVFALALTLSAVSSCFTFLQANVALWTALQLPWCPRTVRKCFPSLFVHLLFQVFFNTVHRLEEDDAFWKECQDQHSLP